MASSMIHICIANEINKKLKRNNKDILIGSIAPDISKQIGMTKEKSHFLDNVEDNLPNLERFINKYEKKLNNDFVLGYYIHLYTDYLWFKYFVPDFVKNGVIYKLDGSKALIDEDEKIKYFYNDYSNLNITLIDEYELDLSIFYEEIPYEEKIIDEIPMDKLQVIVDQAGIIIENSKNGKNYIFDINLVNKFINMSISIIEKDLKKKIH